MKTKQRPLPNRCQRPPCEAPAYRRCRVCRRWACLEHRVGAGQWWRCLECPEEALAAARALWQARVREERAAELTAQREWNARLAELPALERATTPTFAFGVWWGLWGRLDTLRDVARANIQARTRRRVASWGGAEPEGVQHAPPFGRRSKGRPVPGYLARRWRRGIAERRGVRTLQVRGPRRRAAAAPRWGRAARTVGALALVLLLAVVPLRAALAPLPTAPVALDVGGAVPLRAAELEAFAVDVHAGETPPPPGAPPQPVKGQKKAPCDPRYEVEVSGVCWLPVRARPPTCPPQTVAYGGDCLLPLAQARGPPVSIDGGPPE